METRGDTSCETALARAARLVRTARAAAGPLVIDVDLSPTGACPFACDYCVIPRDGVRAFPEPIGLRGLEAELRAALEARGKDAAVVVLGGSGEPTWSPQFEDALTIVLACVRCFGGASVPVRVLTCGGTLERAHVARALEALVRDAEGEVWIKLDAWDEASYGRINGARAFADAKLRILRMALRIPVVLRSVVARRPGDPSPREVGRKIAGVIRDLLDGGACIERVELATAPRPSAIGGVQALGPLGVAAVAAEIARAAPVRITP